MPMYDRVCETCHTVKEDCMERIADRDMDVRCVCGGRMLRGFTARATAVIADDIPGGLEIRHGLCNADGTPRTYYSKSEIHREAKARGMRNQVEHRPESRDSDKSRHTSRWV